MELRAQSLSVFLLLIIITCDYCTTAQSGKTVESEESEEDIVFHRLKGNGTTSGERNVSSSAMSPRTTIDTCHCTSLFKCDLNMTDSDEDGARLEVIDIRNKLGSKYPCKHYLEICCNHYQHQTVPERPRTPLVNARQCGRRNANGVGFRIVGNFEGEAQMGEFPWMGAITEINKVKGKAEYVCGATLITPRVAVTAAHCLERKFAENLNVRVGEWDTSTEREDPYVHHDREVDQIIIHEEYQKKAVLKNDIALLILSKDVPLARHVGPICLSSDEKVTSEKRCFASGWGKDLFGREGRYQTILKKVDLPLVPSDDCETSLRKTRLGPNFKLHNSFICAGGERGKDTCKGDGGSPLVCQLPNSDQYYLQGIVSWGLNCGDTIPAAYTNVPLFVPWIEEKLRSVNLDSSYFKP